MDLVFLIDTTTSMPIPSTSQGYRDELLQIIDCAASGTGGKLRLGLVQFTGPPDPVLLYDYVVVHTWNNQSFTTDVAAFKNEVSGLSATNGGYLPEPSDEALRVMLRVTDPMIPPSNCA